jgi:hypothetical protein
VIDDRQWLGMISAVSFRLLYLIFQHVFGLVLLMGRTSSTTDVELLVVAAPGRRAPATNPRPRPNWANRAVFARRSSGGRPERCVGIAWSPRTRSCAGTAICDLWVPECCTFR